MKVLETHSLSNVSMVVCELFDDSIVTKTIKSNLGIHTGFHVEKISHCFSIPTTRIITMTERGDFSKLTDIEFI